MSGVIEAEIQKGLYKGATVKVQFGKPMKVFVGDQDVSDVLMRLNIEISLRRGQVIDLEIAELNYSQITSKGGG